MGEWVRRVSELARARGGVGARSTMGMMEMAARIHRL